MIAVVVICRVCGMEHTPDRTQFVQRDYHVCPPCRSAIRDHAERTIQGLGYAPPRPDHPDHDALLASWDSRWRAQLANAERFVSRIHELDREVPDDAA